MIEVFVRGDNIEGALKLFRKRCTESGLFKRLKEKEGFEPRGQRKKRKRREALRRLKKMEKRRSR
jgi:small subunit ribosomal protein S21